MAQLFANNATATLASSILASDVSLAVTTGQGARFPAVVAPDYLLLTLTDGTNVEVVKVTAHTAASDTFTVTRAQETIGTTAATAYAFAGGATAEARLTQATFDAASERLYTPQTSDVTSVPTGRWALYATRRASRELPRFYSQALGESATLQPHLGTQSPTLWLPGATATAPFVMGATGFTQGTTGTIALVRPASGSALAAARRVTWANAATTANQTLGTYQNDSQFLPGSATGYSGFDVFLRFTVEAWATGGRLFVGLSNLTAAAVAASTTPLTVSSNAVGFLVDAADTTWSTITSRGGAGSKVTVSGSPTLAAGQVYDAHLYAPPNATWIALRLATTAGSVIYDGQITGVTHPNFPQGSATLGLQATASNGALTTASVIKIGIVRLYGESLV